MQILRCNDQLSPRRAGKAWIFLVIALVLAGGGVALFLFLRTKDVDDFDLVPRDALGFATLRVADILDSESGKKMMNAIEGTAGGDAIRQLHDYENDIGLKLTDIERISVVVVEPSQNEIWAVIHTKKDIDKEKVLKVIDKVAKYEEKKHEGRKYYAVGPGGEVAICFLSSRQAVVSTAPGMQKCLEVARKGPGSGALDDTVKLAAGDRYQLVAVANVNDILKIPKARKDLERDAGKDGIEGDLAKVFLTVKRVTYTARIDRKLTVALSAEFADADAAKNAVATIERGLQMARAKFAQEKRIPPEMKPLVDVIEQVKPKQDGATVTATMELDGEPLFGVTMFLFGRGPEKGPGPPRRNSDTTPPQQP
jgi:hypothetical protein